MASDGKREQGVSVFRAIVSRPGLASASTASALADTARCRGGQQPTVTGYDTAGWGDLLACAGAAAALAGLIFVGLSVNMSTPLGLDQKRGQNFLTGRALEALVAMLNILVICIVTLTPHIFRGCWPPSSC